MKRLLWCFWLCAGLSFAATAAAPPAPAAPKVALVNGVELHHIEKGSGPAVIFVHGGLEDYRAWAHQVDAFSKRYRAVAYSRRYNFPNAHGALAADYSAIADADDLAALITKLGLAPAHVVGYSYGAYAALFLAQRHPELVRSLVLAEPPVLRLLPEIAGGEPLLVEFMSKVWQPTAEGFRVSDEAGVRAAVNGFGDIGYSGTDEKLSFSSLPPEVRGFIIENAAEWKALTGSKDAFPSLPVAELKRIKTPTLLMGGAQSLALAHAIDGLLVRTLPHARRVVIAKATHDMWSEHPKECRDAAIAFLRKH